MEKQSMPHVDEAVVEEEAEHGGAHRRVLADGLGHRRPYDAPQAGTGPVVECG